MKYIAIFLFFISAIVNANSYFGEKSIKSIVFHDSGQLRVSFEGQAEHSEECANTEVFVLPRDHVHYNEIVAGLMAAMYSHNNVSGWVNGCTTHGNYHYPNITRIDLLPQG